MAEYLKIPEVARRLDVSEKTVRRYIKSGALPSTFIGGAYRVTEEDLEEYIRRSEVKPEAPKAESRSSLEPSLFNGLEEERRSETIKAIFELMERWHARRLAEVEDEASPHFRDPTSAALWIADTREEAQDFCEWLAAFIGNRPRTAEGVQEALELFFGALALDGPAKLGEMRLDDMAAPDELAARRMARAAAGFQASMERVQDLGKAANG